MRHRLQCSPCHQSSHPADRVSKVPDRAALQFPAASDLPNRSLAQAETHAGILFGGIVEVDTGVLRADIDVPKCGLKRARRVHRMRSRTRVHSRHRAPALTRAAMLSGMSLRAASHSRACAESVGEIAG